jgi:hypothetical protein
MRTANGPRMCTNENREGTRLRQAYGAARYEWTRMNGREKAQKAQKNFSEECSFCCPGDP